MCHCWRCNGRCWCASPEDSGHFSRLRDGAVANAVALLLFILTVLASVVRWLAVRTAHRHGTETKRRQKPGAETTLETS